MLRCLARAFDKLAALVACALMVALLGCVSLGVVTRSLGQPVIWTDELSRFLMVWLAVFGWVIASRKRIHVRIRFIQDRLPIPAHKAAEIAIQALLGILGASIFIYSVALVAKNRDLEATTLPISMAWMYAPMVLAGIVTAAQGVREALAALHRAKPISPGDSALVE
ncbi:MAG: TRAP transporter small permease [Betaproteobacteria bacterium]|nr:MAG: TRAP transporter small permease [Betaproteobacteria bacterium]